MAARVVQLSDTHFSAAAGPSVTWRAVRAWLRERPPDLVVHTGDIVFHDPDDEADRRFAQECLADLGAPLVVIPGNHDVGFFDEPADRPARLAAFRRAWGSDTFVHDLTGWRLVGVNGYRLGESDHDQALSDAVRGHAQVAVFIHQPVRGERADSAWRMPPAAVAAFDRAAAGASIRVVASGHWHCGAVVGTGDGHDVWCPSTEFVADPAAVPSGATNVHLDVGVVEHHFDGTGAHTVRIVGGWPTGSLRTRADRCTVRASTSCASPAYAGDEEEP